MSWRTRKKGTIKQVGKKFPVMEKKKLPKLSIPKSIARQVLIKRTIDGILKEGYKPGKPEMLGKHVNAAKWLADKTGPAFAPNAFSDVEEAKKYVKELQKFGEVKTKIEYETCGYMGKDYYRNQVADSLIVKVRPKKEKAFLKFIAGQYISEFDEISPKTYRLWWD